MFETERNKTKKSTQTNTIRPIEPCQQLKYGEIHVILNRSLFSVRLTEIIRPDLNIDTLCAARACVFFRLSSICRCFASVRFLVDHTRNIYV